MYSRYIILLTSFKFIYLFLFPKIVADGLPSVPSIKIHVPRQYPNTSPECLIPNYKSEDCSDLVKELGKRLLDELAQHSGKYTLTYILQSWEAALLEAVSNELDSIDE